MQEQHTVLQLFQTEKMCLTCGELKPLVAFYKTRNQCDRCMAAYQRQYRERNRETLAAQHKAWWAVTREQQLELKRAYYLKNRDAILAKQKAAFRDPEKQAAYNREYRKQNAEQIKQRQRRWYRANAEHVKARVTARGNVGGYRGTVIEKTPSTLAYAQILRRDPCSYCDGGGGIDHIDPVSTGGGGNWNNLTSACRSCNSSKSAAPLLVFLARRRNDG